MECSRMVSIARFVNAASTREMKQKRHGNEKNGERHF